MQHQSALDIEVVSGRCGRIEKAPFLKIVNHIVNAIALATAQQLQKLLFVNCYVYVHRYYICVLLIGSQVGTPQLMTIIVNLLTMVGKVEDNGVTLFEEPYNVVDHKVVVARGVKIIGHTLLLCVTQGRLCGCGYLAC